MAKILLAVTGSIAAYKAAEITRQLKKQQHEVRVVMTQSASEIITPLTLQVLSQNPVRVDLFDQEQEEKIDHIELARWPNAILIAPATANSLAKVALGLADDLLSTLCLATDKPILFAPAMNQQMWKNPITQQHTKTLQSLGHYLISPDIGDQACGETGYGRLAEPSEIINQTLDYLKKTPKKITPNNEFLSGLNIIITAGATIERIDPVRFLSNDSSGKMGYAIAQAAQQLGAKVTLITGKTNLATPKYIKTHHIESADDMLNCVMQTLSNSNHKNTWFISAAAVADYKLTQIAQQKIKKEHQQKLTLQLVENPDILKSVGALKNKPFCIGFAAETENLLANANKKLTKKNADLIAANDVAKLETGFNSDDNAITLIGNAFEKNLPKTDKHTLAYQLLTEAYTFYKKNT